MAPPLRKGANKVMIHSDGIEVCLRGRRWWFG